MDGLLVPNANNIRAGTNQKQKLTHILDPMSPMSAWWEAQTSSTSGSSDSVNHSQEALNGYGCRQSDHSVSGNSVSQEDSSSTCDEDAMLSLGCSLRGSNSDSSLQNTGASGAPRSRLRMVIQELITTEKAYVSDLLDIVYGYMKALGQDQGILAESDAASLFGNIQAICQFNRRFLDCLNECAYDPVKVANCFITLFDGFMVYADYCTNYPRTIEVMELLVKDDVVNDALNRQQRKLGHALPLVTYLFKPVQRILKYPLLLQNLLNAHDPKEPSHDIIALAFDQMVELACQINEVKRRHERLLRTQELRNALGAWQGGVDIVGFGDMVLEDDFRLTGVWGDRHVILFHRAVLIAKKFKDGLLHTKAIIRMSNLLLVESVLREPLHFTIQPFDNQRMQFTLQAKNAEQKQTWCQEIKKLIIENFHHTIPEHAKQVVLGNSPLSDLIKSKNANSAEQRQLEQRRVTLSTLDNRRVRRKSAGALPEYREKKALSNVNRTARENGSTARSSENVSRRKIPKSPQQFTNGSEIQLWNNGAGEGDEVLVRSRSNSRKASSRRGERRSQSVDSVCVVDLSDSDNGQTVAESPVTDPELQAPVFEAERSTSLGNFFATSNFAGMSSGDESNGTDDSSSESGEFCLSNTTLPVDVSLPSEHAQCSDSPPCDDRLAARASPVGRAASFRRAVRNTHIHFRATQTGQESLDDGHSTPKLSKVMSGDADDEAETKSNGVEIRIHPATSEDSESLPCDNERLTSCENDSGNVCSEHQDEAETTGVVTEGNVLGALTVSGAEESVRHGSDQRMAGLSLETNRQTGAVVAPVSVMTANNSNKLQCPKDSDSQVILADQGGDSSEPTTQTPHEQQRYDLLTEIANDASSAAEQFYTDEELLAVTHQNSAGGDDAAEASEHFDSNNEGELWAGRPPHFVFNLARAYSSRVKQLRKQVECSRPRDRKPLPRVNPQATSEAKQTSVHGDGQSLPVKRTSESNAEPSGKFYNDVVTVPTTGPSDANLTSSPSNRNRSASLDSLELDEMSAEGRSVREKIRLLNMRGSCSTSTSPPKHSAVSRRESSNDSARGRMLSNHAASFDSSCFSSSSGNVLVPGGSSIVQERLRMFREKSKR